MKQKFLDVNLIKAEWNIFSIISTITGFILAITGIPNNYNIGILVGFIILFIIIYILIFCYYKFFCNHIELKIGKVDLNVKVGNLFKEEGLKVIPVNEYFDTQVDDVIISQTNRIHNGRVINVPIIGTGISRINPVLSDQEFLKQIIWSLKTSALITSRSKINIIIYTEDKEKISKLKCPTIVVCGEKDSANIEGAKKLNESIKNSELKIIKNAGHELNIDAADKFAEIIKDCLINK